MEGSGIGGEAHEGAHLVPALQPGGAGVDVQETQRLVILHLQDMAVARDEEARRAGVELLPDAPAVPIANVPVSLIWNVNIPFSAVPLIFVFLPSAIR